MILSNSIVLRNIIPEDCCFIVGSWLPHYIVERCYMCGSILIGRDCHNRIHYDDNFVVATEHCVICVECYENFYC